MARAKDPKRLEAYMLYKAHNGNITNREIANKLEIDEKKVATWKYRDKWNVVQQNKKRSTTKNTTNKKQNNKSREKPIVEEVNKVIDNPELTDEQRLFCLYYVKSFNATQSYKKAYGCSYISACASGPRLLDNVRVRKEIERLKAEKLNREFLSAEDIFQKYMDIAFADITDYVSFNNSGLKLNDSNEIDGSLISSISEGREGIKIKMPDRLKALQWLSEHMGMATEKQKAEIEMIKAKTNVITGADVEIEDTSEADKDIYG